MRLISKIDIKEDYVIKSIMYDGVKKIGHPRAILNKLYNDNVDEFFITNFVKTLYHNENEKNILSYLDKNYFLPIIYGGGLNDLNQIEKLFMNGIDKISLNSYIFDDIKFLHKCSKMYGSQSVSVLVQAKKINGKWFAFKNMARNNTQISIFEWSQKCQYEGAGEIILINVDRDGTNKGFDESILEQMEKIKVPLVVSGGIASLSDVEKIRNFGFIDGISVNSSIYSNKLTIESIKKNLI